MEMIAAWCGGTRERFAGCQSRNAYAFRYGVKFAG